MAKPSSNDFDKRSLGPVSDLEKHLPSEWWKTLFNSLYLKTDGDVVENDLNTIKDIDMVLQTTGLQKDQHILDLCCGQGRHSLELAKRGYTKVTGLDRSKYLIRLAKKRAQRLHLPVSFHEGDARKLRMGENSLDCVSIMGNSFGYFERDEDDLAIIKSIVHVLKNEAFLVLDLVNGNWMKNNFEKRSWEWIDQNHFVNRERSLSSDGKRIISREVITHSERGIIADQFYAERLYSEDEIKNILISFNFKNIRFHDGLVTESTRNQDLGMMSNRMFITAQVHKVKQQLPKPRTKILDVAVVMGDPSLPDNVKKNMQFNEEDFATIQKLKDALSPLKSFSFRYLNSHKTLLEDLNGKRPDLVFNLCDEGFNNQATLELHVPAFCEMLGIPYTGAAPVSLGLCYNKSFVRSIAQSIEVPTPMETYYDPQDQAANLPSIFPALIKPNCGDSSIGITQHAVVYQAEDLLKHISFLKDTLPGTAILIQEYLQGEEYSVGIIGNPGKFHILPPLQVDYSGLPQELPKILAYESKWLPESPYWQEIRYKEAELSDEKKRNLIDYSCMLFERMQCRDYARFDFREDSKGNIKLLEVNPNPGWCWDGKFNFMAEYEKMSYSQMLERILMAAVERLNL